MQSMLKLWGSGGMPPQENFQKRSSEIASKSIFHSKTLFVIIIIIVV